MSDSPRTLLDAAAELARAAGAKALAHYAPGIAVDLKADG